MKLKKKITNLKKNFKNNFKNNDFYKDEDEKDKRRIILYIIIIVILLLLLITSCTSGFFGKIGDLFRNEGNYNIDKDRNDKEEVLNQDLKFDSETFEVSETDTNLKVGFSYNTINPDSFTCTTTDASIATCYVSDGYVIVNPKSRGEVTLYLQTSTNGKIYKASTKVVITEGTRKIDLTSTSGTIYLGSSTTKNVAFALVGLSGNVSVSSSDERIATASIEDNILKIKALKAGSATLTLNLEYNGKMYTATYTISVKEGKNPNAVGTGNSSKPNEPSNPEKPENPSNPTDPTDPEKPDYSKNDSTLKSITSNQGLFSKVGDTYYLGVGPWISKTSIAIVPNQVDAIVELTYKRADKEEYEIIKKEDLENLKLKMGDNILVIKVVSPNQASTSIYTAIINRAYSSRDYLKDISIDGATIPDFDKNTLSYELFVPNETNIIHFSATPWSKKANVSFSYNGVSTTNVDTLNLLTGPNTIKIFVTDNDGNTRTYSVIINRIRPVNTEDTNSYLKDLTITSSKGNIDFGFDTHIFDYSIGVSNDVEKVLLSSIPSSNNSSVEIMYTFNGQNTYNPKKEIELKEGANEVVIIVTNHGEVKTYKVNINRATKNKNNTLADLIVEGFTITPSFSENTLEYNVKVPEGTTSVKVKGIARTDTTIVTYSGNNVLSDGSVNLVDGNNIVYVKVGALENERTYKVNVYRESSTLSNDASIESVLVEVPGETSARDITSTYKTIVNKDTTEVTLKVKTTSASATITYNGSESGVVSLKPGINPVLIQVVAEDGTAKTYEVTIEREKEKVQMDAITINGENLTGDTTTIYIDRNTPVTILETPTENLELSYTYNNKEYTSVSELEKDINSSIKNGRNEVKINVSTKDGSKEPATYLVYLVKDKNYVTLSATGGNTTYSLEQVDSTGINYNLEVFYNEKYLNVSAYADDPLYTEVTYFLNDEKLEDLSLLNSKLKDYNNTLTIKVSSTDGSVNNRIYTITIVKPTRKLEIVSSSSDCYLENDSVCSVKFKVLETKDGNTYYPVKETMDSITFQVDNQNVSLVPIEFTEEGIGEIRLIPSSILTAGDVNLTLGIKDYNANLVNKVITFKIHSNYELFTKLNRYTLGVSTDANGNVVGMKNIILYSQNKALFNGKVLSDYDSINKTLTIWDEKDATTKVIIRVNDDASIVTSLRYNPETDEIGPTSLPILITAQNIGEATLSVQGYFKGSPINDGFTIQLEMVQKYIVNLYANGGTFDINSKEESSLKQSFLLDKGDTLALSKMIPFKSADINNCTYYEFLGYSEDKESQIASITGDYTISESTKPVTNFYAIYNNSDALKTTEGMEFKTMWIFDPELFINKKANNQTLIYPGASGEYNLNFTNTTGSKIKIVGVTLAEDTVCVTEGCLNMGYILKNSITGTYYLGDNDNITCGEKYCNSNYRILNGGKNTTRNTNKITFDENEVIELDPEEGITLYLDWKWVDSNNSLDTAIGKKAKTTTEEEINDKYHFNLAIHYKIVTDSCPLE